MASFKVTRRILLGTLAGGLAAGSGLTARAEDAWPSRMVRLISPYGPGGSADPGELGRHELGIFEAGGLRSIRIARGPAEWTGAELSAPAQAHMLLGYGFAPRGEPHLVYTPETWFETEPARKLA